MKLNPVILRAFEGRVWGKQFGLIVKIFKTLKELQGLVEEFNNIE